MNREIENMIVFAARYAHGRQTGAALQAVTCILNEWTRLGLDIREMLYRESFEAQYCQEHWKMLQDRYEEDELK